MSQLPSIIGNTIGNLAADAVAGRGSAMSRPLSSKGIQLAGPASAAGGMWDEWDNFKSDPIGYIEDGASDLKSWALKRWNDVYDTASDIVVEGQRLASQFDTSAIANSVAMTLRWGRSTADGAANAIAASPAYQYSFGSKSLYNRYIAEPFYTVAGAIDPGFVTTMETSGVPGFAAGGGVLGGLRSLSVLRAEALATRTVAVTGETLATATGKSVHAELAAARRASGEFDLVNEPLVNASGAGIQVPKRVNLVTGRPLDARLQVARPDAVRFKNNLILDDKPLGRPIAKDRQEIIRFIDAYTKSQGNMPSRIAIQRYDPITGRSVVTEMYGPEEFLPRGR
jgi:hypothetical protein